jgi:thiamine-phosphate pyrophosphorylase
MTFRLPPVYPITDKEMAGRSTHREIVRELIRGGARLIQVRDKDTPVRELLLDLQRTVELAARHGAAIVVNDRVDLALLAGAAGVHVGQDDLPPAAARRVLGPRALVGCSSHTAGQFRSPWADPADYVAFGPIFPTATKRDAAATVGLQALRRITRGATRPVVAIGGIGLEQVREVLEAGAASAAVISAVMRAPDLARRMALLLEAATAPRASATRADRPPESGRRQA